MPQVSRNALGGQRSASKGAGMRGTNWIRLVLCGFVPVSSGIWSPLFSSFSSHRTSWLPCKGALLNSTLGRRVLLRGRHCDGHLGDLAVFGHRPTVRSETNNRRYRGRCLVDDQEFTECQVGRARIRSTRRRRSHRIGGNVADRRCCGIRGGRVALRQGGQAGRQGCSPDMKDMKEKCTGSGPSGPWSRRKLRYRSRCRGR